MIDVAHSNDIYYYHFDGVGSVVAISDSNSNLVEKYSYDVFGEPNITSTINNPYYFTGRRYDTETSLYYYRARYYAPDIGRFLQTDPVGYDDGLNLYTYCHNNPTTNKDALGLSSWKGLLRPNALVVLRTKNSLESKSYRVSDATDFVKILIQHKVSGEQIAELEYFGHGDVSGQGLNIEVKYNERTRLFSATGIYNDLLTVDSKEKYDVESLSNVIRGAFSPQAKITFHACYSARGPQSIARAFSNILLGAQVFGYTGGVRVDPLFGIADPKSDSAFVKIRQLGKGCSK